MVYTTINIKEQKHTTKQRSLQIGYRSVLYIILIGVSILGLRGGLQLKPINLIDAGKMTSSDKVPLVLNTPFSIIVTQGKQQLELKVWYTEEQAKMLYNPTHNYNQQDVPAQKKNVVVLIMESFSSYKVGYFNPESKSLTPFLDSLLSQSLTFNGIANGKKSIEGIPAILSGIPSLMRQPFLTSTYAANQFSSLASILKKHNYTTAFFHGGKNGTMNLDSYAMNAGFDSYFGMDEYDSKTDYDGSWGIYDHAFFPFFKTKLDAFEEPFAAAFFSLSSHHPYSIPEQYQGRFNEYGPLDNSIVYADFALSEFFELAKNEDWFYNTLFILTADHTAEIPNKIDPSSLVHFEIPIVFYSPGDTGLIFKEHRKIAQQSDILPTIVDYLHFSDSFVAFGNSIFDTTAPDFALYYLNEIYHGSNPNSVFEFNGADFTFLPKEIAKTNSPEKKNDLQKDQIRSLIQNYSDYMIHNKLGSAFQK